MQVIYDYIRISYNNELPTIYSPEIIPVIFDPDKLPKIDRHQMVWFNKMHTKQEDGSRIYESYQIRFSRDVHGKYCSSSSMIADESFRTAYKYAGEARFCFGCEKIKLLNGDVKG